MFIELNEAQLVFANKHRISFSYIERSNSTSCFHVNTSTYDDCHISPIDIVNFNNGSSVFYVHKDDYESLPAEMRALSSPEPNAKATLPETLPLIDVFDEILVERIMKQDPVSTTTQEPTKEPDYKALALLLIDLYEEKREIDSKIAAIKAQLQ